MTASGFIEAVAWMLSFMSSLCEGERRVAARVGMWMAGLGWPERRALSGFLAGYKSAQVDAPRRLMNALDELVHLSRFEQ